MDDQKNLATYTLVEEWETFSAHIKFDIQMYGITGMLDGG